MQNLRYKKDMEQSDTRLCDQRWQAMIERDRQADGSFFFGVSTTGIFCRPSCPSRLPRRENVHFFDSVEEALQAGYRPCKRCQPHNGKNPHFESMLQACRTIEDAERALTLEELAGEAGLSPHYFQRIFKKIIGVSPRQYFIQVRSKRMQQLLQEGQDISGAIYDAGFGSSSRFYSQSDAILGMTAGDYRRGAEGLRIAYAIRPCSLDWVLVAATETGICAIHFGDSPQELEEALKKLFPQAQFDGGDEVFAQQVKQVIEFIDRPRQGLHLPLDIRGTAFQRLVWQTLQDIRPGSTASYTELAEKIGRPKAVRAVANACAANQIAAAIPCHRIVRSDGKTGGYHWGVDRKKKLLEREKE